MSLIIPAAIITAITLLYVLSPIFGAKEKTIRNKAMIIGILIALAVIITYSLRGYPDLQASPALFEISGDRFEARNLQYMEYDLETAYKLSPDNIGIALNLVNSKIMLGKIDDTMKLLEEIIEQHPNHPAAQEILNNIRANLYN